MAVVDYGIRVLDGSVSAPTLSFLNDTDSGWYLAADEEPRLAVAGVDALSFDGANATFAGKVVIDKNLSIINSSAIGLTIENTSTGINAAPVTVLQIKGRDTADASVTYQQIVFSSTIATPGSEDGDILFRNMVSGTLATALSLFGIDATVAGDLNVLGTITTRHVVPSAANTYDLGESGNYYKKLWASKIETIGTGEMIGPWNFTTGVVALMQGAKLSNNARLIIGGSSNYWMLYDLTNTAFEFWSTTGGGGNFDRLIFSVQDGADDILFSGNLTVTGNHGFFGQDATAKPTGVTVDAAAIHAALVTLNLIAGP